MIKGKLWIKPQTHKDKIYNNIFPLNLTNVNGLYTVTVIIT